MPFTYVTVASETGGVVSKGPVQGTAYSYATHSRPRSLGFLSHISVYEYLHLVPYSRLSPTPSDLPKLYEST